MSGPDSHYTELPAGVVNASHATFVSPDDMYKKKRDPSRLANIALVLSFVMLVGALGFAVTRSQQTTGTRADFDSSLVAKQSSAEQLLEKYSRLTPDVISYPKTYNGKTIKPELAQQGEQKYQSIPAAERTKIIANKIVLYYAFDAMLKSKQIDVGAKDDTFENLENSLLLMYDAVKSTFLHQADYVFVHADFEMETVEQENTLQEVAYSTLSIYHSKMVANPSAYQTVLDEANADVTLGELNGWARNEYVQNYVDDDNDVIGQYPLLFDEDFDDILFMQKQGEVSKVFLINSIAPYRYFFVYPTRIEKKEYQSMTEIMTKQLPLFTF